MINNITDHPQKRGCQKERVYRKHSCSYHSKEKRNERHMNSMIFCKGCSCEMGKRKDVPNKRRCDDCKIKIKKENNIKNRKYINEYYKDRYNNDEEYRKRVREYQTNYNKKKRLNDKEVK